MKLQVFIPLSKVMENKEIFHGFSQNKNAIPFLEKFLEENPDKLDWIQWDWLSNNKNALPILQKHVDKINWYYFSMNSTPEAFALIEIHFERVKDFLNWNYITANPNAISLLEKNPDKIVWNYLRFNSNPLVAKIMAKHPDKIPWENLYYSTSVLICSNLDMVDWKKLTSNPCIFLTEDFLKNRVDLFREELMQQALHPRRIAQLLNQDGDVENCI